MRLFRAKRKFEGKIENSYLMSSRKNIALKDMRVLLENRRPRLPKDQASNPFFSDNIYKLNFN